MKRRKEEVGWVFLIGIFKKILKSTTVDSLRRQGQEDRFQD